MVKGYLLIKLVPGFESSALSQIRAIPGVTDINLVFGQWDAIATAEAKTLFELARIIVGEYAVSRGYRIRLLWYKASYSDCAYFGKKGTKTLPMQRVSGGHVWYRWRKPSSLAVPPVNTKTCHRYPFSFSNQLRALDFYLFATLI